MNAADATLCRATACWLAACARCGGALGVGIGVVAALALLAPRSGGAAAAFAAALLLVLPERVLALRVAFDAGLFRALAAGRPDGAAQALPALDTALQALRLRAAAAPRPLAERVAGARRLGRHHLGVVLAQTVALALALALHAAAGAP